MALSERAKRNWEKMKEQNAQRWEEEDPTPAQNERKQKTVQTSNESQRKTIVKPNAKSVSTGKQGQSVMVTDAGEKAVQREREQGKIMKPGKSVSSGKPGEAVMVSDTGTGDAVAERTARRERYQAEYDKAYSELYQKNHSSRIGGRGKRVYRKAGSKDAAQIDALQDEVDSLQSKMDTIDLLNEYDDKVYDNNFGGIVGSNYHVGELGQRQAQAAYDLMQDPYDADKQAYLNAVNTVTENFVAQNQDALNREIGSITSEDAPEWFRWIFGEADTDSKFLKNWASNVARWAADTGNANIQYLPQLKYQVMESIIPTFIGVLGGGLAGNPVTGAKIGYSLGTANYSYETMAGAAYQSLLELGADPETAKRLASDEAFLSSLIEGADTFTDLMLFGGKAAGEAVAKKLGKGVAKKAAKKATGGALKAVGGYLGNALQEAAEEGTQEAVSIANENRFLNGYTGEDENFFQRVWGLTGDAAGTYIDAMKGALPWWEENENTERILEASKGGVQVALGMGALGMGTSNLTNTILDNTVNADPRYINLREGTAQQAQSLDDVTGTVIDPAEIQERQRFTNAEQDGWEITQEAPFQQLTQQEQQEMWQSMGLTEEQQQAVRERFPYGTYTQEELETFLQNREALDKLLRSFDREQQTAQETQERQTEVPGDITTQQEIAQQTAPVQEMQQNPEVAAQMQQNPEVMQQTEDPGDVALQRLAAEMDQRQQAEDAARAQREIEDFEAAQTAIYQQQNQQRWNRSRETVKQAGYGLAESSTTDKWSRQDVASVNKMAQQLGVEVYTANARQLGGGAAEGSITGNVVLLDENTTATEAVRRIYGHEIGHRIKDLAPEEFNVYVDAVREVMPDFDEQVELKQALLAANHRDSSVNAATEEVAADYAGRLMSDGDTMERFIQQNQHRPSLLKRLAEAFRELWRKLTGKERTQAEEAAYRLEKAYEAAVEAQRKGGNAGGRERLSFAKLQDMSIQQQAEEMEAEGKTPEEIWNKLGVTRTMDGKAWRYEIDDSGMKYDPTGDVRGATSRRWALESLEAAKADLQNALTNEQMNDVRKYNGARVFGDDAKTQRLYELNAQKYGDVFTDYVAALDWARQFSIQETDGMRLSDFVEHRELFDAHPYLKDIYLRFEELPGSVRGQYDRYSNTITLNSKYAFSREETLLHEIQHVIQRIDNMPGGSSVEYWRNGENYDTAKETLIERIQKRINALEERLPAPNERWTEAADNIVQEIETLEDRILQIRNGALADGAELYRNTAGEIEARDSAARKGLSAEQRRQKMPAIADENTVFAGDSSLSDEYIDGAIGKEEIQNGILAVSKMVPVVSLSGEEFKKSSVDLVTQVSNYFNEVGGMVYNPQLGDCTLNRRGIKDDIAHGIGRNKAAAFAAVPEVLKNGKVIDYQTRWKGRSYDTAVVSAPISISGEKYLEGIVLIRENNENRFYVHEVLMEKGATPFKTGESSKIDVDTGGDAPSVISLLRKVQFVNENFDAQTDTSSRASLRTDAELEAAVREIQRKRESGEISAEEARQQISEITQKAAKLNPDFQELKKDNKKLLRRVEGLKRQMTITPEHTARQADTDRVANSLLRDFSSKADRADIKQAVYALANKLLRAEDTAEVWESATQDAQAIMWEIIENAAELNDTFAEEYKDIKQYLRSTPLVISETDSHDITDFAALKKSMRGTMRISVGENGNIDRVFADMADRWPGFFNTEETTHPADILTRIADVVDELAPVFENPFDADMEAAVSEGANMLLETMVSDAVREAVPTFADKQAAKLAKQKAEYKAKISELLERKRKEQAAAVSEAKKEGKRALQARQKQTETRAKIKRHTQAMSTKLLNPTDTKHVPSGLKTAVAKLLESINLDSERDSKNREQRVAALAKLKAEYQKIILDNDSGIVDNPDLLGDNAAGFVGLFDRVIAMGDKSIYKMTQEELDTVWAVVRSMETAISTAGKTLANEKAQTIREMASSFEQDVSQKRPKPQKITNALRQDMMNPYSFFHQYGEIGTSIWRELRNAQDTQTIRIQEIAEKVQNKISPQLMKQAQKTVHTFKLESGKEITLTDAQIMNLYNLMQRQQAQDHLMKGGVVQPEVKVGKTKVSRGTEMLSFTLRDLLQITDVLSTDEKAAAETLQKLTGDMAVWGNEASEKAYGYRKFTEANYWPIKSAQEALHSNVEKGQNNTRAIKNIGMAKNTVPHASTALDIGDIFDVFSQHTADMIDYSTWLLPMEDMNRFFNHKYVDENGVRTGKTVKGTLERIGGKGSQAYWMRLMEDIQNGINPIADTQSEKLVNKIVGNAKGAAVGANIRVILQQPTAFARAYAVMNPMTAMHGIFSRGVTGGNGWKKAQKYSGIGLIKAIGGFDQGNARSVKQQLFGNDGFMSKVNEISGAGAEAADAITWGWLWNASEWQAKRENPNLKPGSEAFYQKTAAIFTDVIEQTQVVDGILQRTQIMRSGNAFNKQATAFMGEPLTTLNLLTRSWDEMRYSADKTERKQARGKLARSLFAVAFTSVVNAAVQSVPDAFRDDDKENDWWDRFLNAMLGFTSEDEGFLNKSWKFVIYGNTGSNLNPAGWVPYMNDVLSMIQGYDVTRADADVISDVVKNVQDLWSVAQGGGAKQPIYVAKRLLTSVATALGVPVKSLTRDIWSVVLTGFEAAGQWETVYELTKVLYKPGHASNKSRYISLLYRAKKENPEDYDKIRKDILDNGYFESTGKTAQKQTPAERRKDAAKKIEDGVKKLEEEAKEREESRKK